MPVVSVIMPVYNAETYVAEAIESILHQTFSDLEFIIIDDGSSDDSIKLIEQYTDPRIKFSRHEQNVNLVGTLNEGIALSRGKYIARMDADDISDPERLKKQVDFLESNPEIGAVGTWATTINHPVWDHLHYYVSDEEIRIHMIEQIPFAHPTVMIRKEVLETHDLKYDQEFLEDYRLWFELSKVTQLANIAEYLLNYRFHEKQFSKRFKAFHKENAAGLQKEVLEGWAGRSLEEEESSVLIRLFSSYSEETNQPVRKVCALLDEVYSGMINHDHITKEQAGEYLLHHAYRVCVAHYLEGATALRSFSKLPFIHLGTVRHLSLQLKLFIKISLKYTRFLIRGK